VSGKGGDFHAHFDFHQLLLLTGSCGGGIICSNSFGICETVTGGRGWDFLGGRKLARPGILKQFREI
jgi:hypothetical protein